MYSKFIENKCILMALIINIIKSIAKQKSISMVNIKHNLGPPNTFEKKT